MGSKGEDEGRPLPRAKLHTQPKPGPKPGPKPNPESNPAPERIR